MASQIWLRPRVAITIAFLAIISQAQEVTNRYDYCIKYYGYLSAEVDLSGIIPSYNYNGTILCPDDLLLPGSGGTTGGATLQICPPLDPSDTTNALSIFLTYSDRTGELSGPIDNLDLHDILVTNGSVTHAFENNAIPAHLAPDPFQSQPFATAWTVNGTQYSFVTAPDETDTNMGVYFSCRWDKSPYYCGFYQDVHEGGCWSGQSFYFNMRNPLNFTMRFTDQKASFEIWAEQELIVATKPTGNNSRMYLSFKGDRQLPSVVDYGFWTNTESDYESEQAYLATRKNLKWEADSTGMPLLLNDTNGGGGGEWYDAGNGTFKQSNGASGSHERSSWSLLAISIFGVLASMLLL